MTLLVFLLRFAGVMIVLAFPMMLLPTDWMAATHAWLGLGEFPRVPVMDYLTRSIAALYGFHGVLLLLVSRDPVRYQTIIRFIGTMNVLFGTMMLAIGIHAGMPAVWILVEGPPIAAFGVVILFLSRQLR